MGEGKRVTPKHVLRPIDAPAAAQVLAIPAPPRIHTAATVPALHRPWKVALAAGFLRIVDGRAVIGPALGQWPGADDDTVRELWLTGLTAAFAANFSSEDETGAAAFSRVILRALVTDPPPSLANLWERAREALMFGRWALQELNARMPKPISADLPAEELIARIADCGGNDAWPWLADRDPLPAAREILQAAAVATPAQRVAAVELVFMLDEPAHAAWHEVSTVANLAAHARMALTGWSRPTARGSEDSAWLAVDYAVAALTNSGPDEALSCIDERIAGEDLDSRIRVIAGGGHPCHRVGG